VVLTRVDCSLCDEMLAELAALGRRSLLPPLQLLDVDADPQLRRRYGLKVPVLLLAGSLVCSGRLDEAELRAALAALARRREVSGASPEPTGQAGQAGRAGQAR
jgi:Glutaredoxin-like domain (DUF836)